MPTSDQGKRWVGRLSVVGVTVTTSRPLAVQTSFDELGTPLRDVVFVVVDLETTGGSPAAGSGITEIGAVKVRGGEVLGEFQTLVDPGEPIPPFISVLTGITDAKVAGACVGHIYDPDTVKAAMAAGVGKTVKVSLGGHIDAAFGAPIDAEAHVQALSDGTFINDGPMGKGTKTEMGPTAVLRVGGVEVIVISNRLQNTDRQTFLSQGIDPTQRRVVVVKSVHHFRAAYAPIAREVMVVDSGALCTPDVKRHTYSKLRRPIWPLDDVSM